MCLVYQVKWSGDAGSVTINDTSYQLIQCHWHSPSEHTFNGTRFLLSLIVTTFSQSHTMVFNDLIPFRFPLEIHEVYGTPDGKKAVVAIIYKYGLPDPFISRVSITRSIKFDLIIKPVWNSWYFHF